MEVEKLLKYDELGRNHWWLTSKYNILCDLLRQFYNGTCPDRILDIGCGSGVFMGHLKMFRNDVFGIDIAYDIIRILSRRDRDAKAAVADAGRLPFKDNSFDLATLIDVLEHTEDDRRVVNNIKKALSSGGLLVLTVPAYNMLYGNHDRLYGHKRRYNRRGIMALLKDAGFDVLRATYFQAAFVAPLWVKRKVFTEDSDKDDFFRLPKPINVALHTILCQEKYFLRRFNFPFGTTLVCFARKP